MGRDFRLAPEVELAMAQANLELVKAGLPPKYDLSNPTDKQISNPMGSYLWNWMSMWSSQTRSDAGTIDRIRQRTAERRAEWERKGRENAAIWDAMYRRVTGR